MTDASMEDAMMTAADRKFELAFVLARIVHAHQFKLLTRHHSGCTCGWRSASIDSDDDELLSAWGDHLVEDVRLGLEGWG